MHHPHHQPPVPEGVETATDPVCGMKVAVTPEARHGDFQRRTFPFCSDKCQTAFRGDPWFYASGRAMGCKAAAPAGTKWTCPIHPEIVRDAPGSCPIRGMAQEPMIPTDGPNSALADFTRRMWISAAASAPLIVLTMGKLVALPLRDWIGHRMAAWVELLLATPIVLWAAAPFFRRGWESIGNRSPNMWTLISLGVGAAWLYSVVATFLPGLFPAEYRMGHGVGTYFEAAVVIVALVFVGQVLELRARERTGDAIRATTAEAVAARLGIDEVRADVVPEDKKNLIDALRKEAAADVGIAMGTGADVAVESAGLTLLGGDLMGVVRARRPAKAKLRNIKENLFFALVYNAAGVPIAGVFSVRSPACCCRQ